MRLSFIPMSYEIISIVCGFGLPQLKRAYLAS
jgi:hypothetical protein